MDKLIKCEQEYSKCFCTIQEEQDLIRFKDESLPEMRDYNFTYIKHKDFLKELCEEELKTNTADFLKIVIDSYIEIPIFTVKNEVTKIGYYTFDTTKINNIKVKNTATIKKVSDKKILEDILVCDLKLDNTPENESFYRKKNARNGEVYLGDNELDAYVCYKDGNAVGACELFIFEDTAKIENLIIIPEYQRRGYATYLLKHTLEIALERNVSTVYLITDEEDSVKEMYLKLYFNKVGERADLLFSPF